jgi:hypothetical protein
MSKNFQQEWFSINSKTNRTEFEIPLLSRLHLYKMKILYILIASCMQGQISYSQQITSLKRGLVTPETIAEMIDTEKQFAQNDSTPPPQGAAWFKYISGSKNILVIAGHATAQTRQGNIKGPDSGTGSLAQALHQLGKVHILYTTYMSPSDPNFYDNNAFKDTLAKLLNAINPVFVIDLHGSNYYRSYDIDFGTMHDKSYRNRKLWVDKLISLLIESGIGNLSKDFFPAEANQTVTKFVYNMNIPVIQMEINSVFLNPQKDDIHGQKTSSLLQALLRFINHIAP